MDPARSRSLRHQHPGAGCQHCTDGGVQRFGALEAGTALLGLLSLELSQGSFAWGGVLAPPKKIMGGLPGVLKPHNKGQPPKNYIQKIYRERERARERARGRVAANST